MTGRASLSDLPNPLIPGFNPDPSCVAVDGTYYLVTSSFEYLPGLPVYRSTDLVTWSHVSNVVTREEQVGLTSTPSGAGVWAPTIRYRDGVFYVIVCLAASGRTCVVFTTDDPAGCWSDGVTVAGVRGIDPDLAWDEAGRAYITWSAVTLDCDAVVTHGGIVQARVDLAIGALLEQPRALWSGTGLIAPEAPHLFRRDGYWYLLIAEGGTEWGHSVSVARARSIEGPFEGAPTNPVLRPTANGSGLNCVGHADLLPAPAGGDVFVLLATRSVGHHSPLGRETFVTGVTWYEGWPVAAPVTQNPRSVPVEEAFDFSRPDALADLGWLSIGRPPTDVAMVGAGRRSLGLQATGNGMTGPRAAFVGRRQRHLRSRFEAGIQASEGEGGLALRYSERFVVTLSAAATDGGHRVTGRAVLPGLEQSWTVDVRSTSLRLRIETDVPTTAPPWAPAADRMRLVAVDEAGSEVEVVELDGRFWSVEAAASFTGRVVGLFAEQGVVRFTDARYFGAAGT